MKFALTLASLKAETPQVARRIGNALLGTGMVVAGMSVTLQHDAIAIGAAIASAIGKFLTEFFSPESAQIPSPQSVAVTVQSPIPAPTVSSPPEDVPSLQTQEQPK